jgi:hypothetical protein
MFCLVDSMAVLTDIFWSTLCQSYWILCCWIFREMWFAVIVPHTISVVTRNYPEVACTGQWIERHGPVSWPSHSTNLNLDFFPFGTSKKIDAHFSGDYCKAFKMVVHQSPTLLAFFSVSVQALLGQSLWQCKANSLSTCYNPNNSCYPQSLKCKPMFLVSCGVISWIELIWYGQH